MRTAIRLRRLRAAWLTRLCGGTSRMHETARQLSAQLDAKLSLLQSLIAEADRAAARLEDVLDRTRPTLPPGSQAESLRPAAGHARDVRPEVEEVVADSEPATAAGESPPATDRARRREEIYRLADYGFAAAEIAHRVGSPMGEVELILSLRDSNSRHVERNPFRYPIIRSGGLAVSFRF